MKKQLRKPENWQDFENLCKVLWGEIWSCKEIKKNGRNGQNQQGVDVFGTPLGEIEYYGIQCKGKDDYTKSKLTEKEIDDEVINALQFKPKLKKLYFATTANKDSAIEEYIRIKDEESRRNGNFEIHLFSWEDIVDLIDENKRTHDWYVANIGFKLNHSIKVFFSNGEKTIYFQPKMLKNNISYRLKKRDTEVRIGLPHMLPVYNREDNLRKITETQPNRYYLDGMTHNLSSCVFNLVINNDGKLPIENFKMYINFKSSSITVDTVYKQKQFLDPTKYTYNTFMY